MLKNVLKLSRLIYLSNKPIVGVNLLYPICEYRYTKAKNNNN